MSSLDDGLFFIVDIDGRHLFTSAALHAFFGRPPRGTDETSWPELIHPEDLGYVRSFCADAFRRRCSFAAWWRILRHDGVFVWAMIEGAPMGSQLSEAPMAYVATIDPLRHPDAFSRAGGVIGPERPLDKGPQGPLSRVERLADLTLMASAMARDMGEAEIAAALDEPLRKIGFRLARLTEPPSPSAAASLSTSFRRAPRKVGKLRRRSASRG